MDEPCQQSMKEASLKNLFEVCSDITDKQIILFCSSQPMTEEKKEMKEENKKESQEEGDDNVIETKNVIDKLLVQLKDKKITKIAIEPKAIKPLEE